MGKSPTGAPPSLEDFNSAAMAAMGSLFEPDDRVSITTHSGGLFVGTIEDANLAGVLVRTEDAKLFFVSFAGMESSEIFESEEDGEGETDDEPEPEPEEIAGPDAGAPVTSIAPRAA